MFTDGTNVTMDFGKVIGAFAVGVFLFLSVLNYGFKGSTWDPVAWATGFGVLAASIVGASKVKDFSVPKDKE